MTLYIHELRLAFRTLKHRPGLTLFAMLALAFSIGMATTAFSILNALLFKPLPYEDARQLIELGMLKDEGNGELRLFAGQNYTQLKKELEPQVAIGGFYVGTINVSGGHMPERYEGAYVSVGLLDLLKIKPVLGRLPSEADVAPGTDSSLLISESVWRQTFRADNRILERSVRVNGESGRIIGVLPDGFHFPNRSLAWVPFDPSNLQNAETRPPGINLIGRMIDNLTLQQAKEIINESIARTVIPGTTPTEAKDVDIWRLGTVQWLEQTSQFWLLILFTITCILLLACANIANLLLGRASTRHREMSLRMALGASRTNILIQLLLESLVLSILGGIGGLLFAVWMVDALRHRLSAQIPSWLNIQPDWLVLLFIVIAVVAAGILSGVLPAWQASRSELNETLKEGSRSITGYRSRKFTRWLAVLQISLACALLFAAGITSQALWNIKKYDPGYPGEKIMTMRMGLFDNDYPSESSRREFYTALEELMLQEPGIAAAGLSSWLSEHGNMRFSFNWDGSKEMKTVETLPSDPPRPGEMTSRAAALPGYAFLEIVSDNYYNTLGINLIEGQRFSAAPSELEMILNRTMADQLFPDSSAVGKTLTFPAVALYGADLQREENAIGMETARIVGVVADVKVTNILSPKSKEPIIYISYRQRTTPFMTLMARGQEGLSNHELTEAMIRTVQTLDPNLPVYFVRTMNDFRTIIAMPYQVAVELSLLVALLALFLAGSGIYAVIAFNVSHKRQEIGIRMALGASPMQILNMLLKHCINLVSTGILVGIALAFLIGELIHSIAAETNPRDLTILIAVLILVFAISIWACLFPSHRATRMSPMEVLRYE